jgi:glycosyltransferase involved in cell wall biosynthesis
LGSGWPSDFFRRRFPGLFFWSERVAIVHGDRNAVKIVIVTDFFGEGLEYQENLMAKYYVKYGHDVTVLTSCFTNVFDYYADKASTLGLPSVSESRGYTIHRLSYSFNLLNRLRGLRGFSALLGQLRPDLIVMHDIMPNLIDAAGYCKQNKDARLIMPYHADASNSGKGWLSRRVLHGVLRRALLTYSKDRISRIFPVAPAGIDFLKELYGVESSAMELLTLGSDVDEIETIRRTANRSEIRGRHEIPEDAFVVFTGGKLGPGKRTELVIEAVANATAPVHLLVIGQCEDPKWERILKASATECPRIHFAGWLATRQIYEHLYASDVAVFPASQSVLWQHAIASGLPLLVGNSGLQDVEFLNAGVNMTTLSAKKMTATAIEEWLDKVRQDDGLRAEMVKDAARATSEHLDWNHLIHRTLQFNEKRREC